MQVWSLLFVLTIGIIFLAMQPYPVLHDYPEWIYQGHIAYSLFSGENPHLAEFFEWVPLPVPNSISQVAIAVLNFFVSPVVAGNLWLGVYLLLVPVVGYLACKTHQYPGAMLWLFIVTIAFGPGFWNGYINFQFGLLWLALFVATGASHSLLWIFIFSVVIYFSHASVFAGFVCYVVLREIFNNRRLLVITALMPSLVLLLWYSIAHISEGAGSNERVGSVVQWLQYKLYTLAKQGPFHNFIRPDGESLMAPVHGLYITGFVANFIVAGCAGIWFLMVAWQMVRSRAGQHQSLFNKYSILGTVIVMLLIWLLAGKNSFGVVNLGERFLIVAMMLLITQMPMPAWIKNIWLSLSVIVAGVTLVSMVLLSAQSDKSYSVDRSTTATELTSYVNDIYKNSRHKYFNHRLFIYANLGQYLGTPESFDEPPLMDHESSIVRMRPR